MTEFTEVAERVWVARYEWFDVNVTLVGGDRGLLAVDTHASALAARGVLDDVRRLGAGEVVGVVNTHEHFDHTFGNGMFRSAYGQIPIHAHETAAARTLEAAERIKGLYRDDPSDPHRDEVLETEVVVADTTFSSAVSLDLGDRAVELVHPGRGHTGGDLVVRVPDVDVLLAGDLVEESAAPGFGGDCYPLEWPLALDIVLGLTTSSTVVVPGHGAPVTRDFVEEQRNAIGIVAETIRDLATRGVPVDQALEVGDWPYLREVLGHAVRRGYEQLPRSQKRLPLI
ncbi:glyoxylase-like metal-dependent hydrolase (beta-lactamase superfamily II) [Nocardioides ginsengisegetis]|uniref:Glyoxylase-like metal-dependent hydrolase (Beta-lactamase superfamily II) n=1 Tax=Nocardioides ginsengisegetis TaxID=661491 RepID=A0A7W3IY15_9ACTN|nr:MBL fold metallo-hydrolase [Nocardioides ginsengisegetis]MBA8802735.1 glyoxylase-like metal-dependent hydrolase (beta-lactamase superfamily II) [Nocardioides ginsengisegetis]